MTPFTLSSWSDVVQRHRALLREHCVEDLTCSMTQVEAGRLFFDEAACATVHAKPAWPEVLAGAAASLVFLGIAIGMFPEPVAAGICGGLAIVLAVVTLLAGSFPKHQLTIRTGDQTMTIILARRRGKREEALKRLLEAVRAWQEKHAPA